MHRLLPLLLVLTVLIFVSLNFQSIRRDLVYKLGISGDPTTSCCKLEEISQSGDFDETATTAIFNGREVSYPKTSLAYGFLQSLTKTPSGEEGNILGTTNDAGEEKWIEISLDDQKVRAWEGSRIVMEFPISSGKWAPTPKGTFNIWYKTRSQTMSGGSKEHGTYYFLPNVTSNMFFHQGYALHGAYWHNNFGQPMSHGCVNAPLNCAAQIFEWAGPVLPPGVNALRASADNPGTRVYVH